MQGAAIEHTTLLGVMLRIAPDPRDPQLINLFGEHRQTRLAVEGNINTVREKQRTVQSTVHDTIYKLLTSGKKSYAYLFNPLYILYKR